MSKIPAVMIIIAEKGKFLLGKRAEWKAKAPGFWCPISGHIEAGESEEEAVVREAREEVGLRVVPVRKITEIDSHDGRVRLHWWLVEVLEGEARIMNNENSELRWLTLEEMEGLQPTFAEDVAIFRKLV